jgi:hypothetical protein
MRTDYPGAPVERACARKKAYPTERLAARVAAKVHDERGVVVVPYGCTRCGQWHLGRP